MCPHAPNEVPCITTLCISLVLFRLSVQSKVLRTLDVVSNCVHVNADSEATIISDSYFGKVDWGRIGLEVNTVVCGSWEGI